MYKFKRQSDQKLVKILITTVTLNDITGNRSWQVMSSVRG